MLSPLLCCRRPLRAISRSEPHQALRHHLRQVVLVMRTSVHVKMPPINAVEEALAVLLLVPSATLALVTLHSSSAKLARSKISPAISNSYSGPPSHCLSFYLEHLLPCISWAPTQRPHPLFKCLPNKNKN
jgi:hypothetical protein